MEEALLPELRSCVGKEPKTFDELILILKEKFPDKNTSWIENNGLFALQVDARDTKRLGTNKKPGMIEEIDGKFKLVT